MEAPVRIENRSQLIYLLTEAAELEHGIMCCYLFAAFSIKKDVSEGITEEQLAMVRGWRGTIMQIAIQEMTHMSLACNLLTAVGGTPHTRRPNLPSSPRAYPPGFQLQFAPLQPRIFSEFHFHRKARSGRRSPLTTALAQGMGFSHLGSSPTYSPANGNIKRWAICTGGSKTGSPT